MANTDKTCEHCRYFVPNAFKSPPPQLDEGRCFRYPPVVITPAPVIPTSEPILNRHPQVQSDNFCGEFQPAD